MELEQLSDSKPTILPLQVDVRPKRVWRLEDGTDLKPSSSSFQETLTQALNGAPSGKDSVIKAQASIKASRQIESLYEGAGFLPLDVLARIEQTGDSGNFENPTDPTYVNYSDKLKAMLSGQDPALAKDVFQADPAQFSERFPGEGTTLAHNATLLYGIGTNPFKGQDKSNNQVFTTNAFYKDLHTQSKSPRSILQKLDPQFWDSMTGDVQLIEDSSLSLKKVKDPFFDNGDIKSFDIHANFNTIVSSQVWKKWTDKQVFSFVNRAWEARSRMEGTLREVVGDVNNSHATTQTALSHVQSWWDGIGSKLDEGNLLPFATLAEVAPAMESMMDWGNWGGEAVDSAASKETKKKLESSGFREKMVSGYLNYMKTTYVNRQFKGKTPIDVNSFVLDNLDQKRQVKDNLITKGFIDTAGFVTSKFDATNPDFNLGIGLTKDQENEVRIQLREASIGQFSLDVQDKTLVNGKVRQDIRIMGSDGQARNLSEVVDLISSGKDPLTQLKNSKLAYEYFFKINASMTGLSLEGDPVSGDIKSKGVDKKIEVSVADSGTWKEWNVSSTSKDLKWQTQSGPIHLQFSNKADAQAFKDKIRMMMALLEPVVGTFNPNVQGGGKEPLALLADNTGSMQSTAFIKEGDSQYQMRHVVAFDQAFFASDIWKAAAKDIDQKAISVIGTNLFVRGTENLMLNRDHKKKQEDWEVKNDDFKEEQVRQIKRENQIKEADAAAEAKAEKDRQESRDQAEASSIAKSQSSSAPVQQEESSDEGGE